MWIMITMGNIINAWNELPAWVKVLGVVVAALVFIAVMA